MFWQIDCATSNIHDLLEKDDVTLTEILEEDDVLQELRNDNHKLLKFLMKDENLGRLVNMIVCEPSEDLEMTKKFKNASLACELLTADINQTEMFCDLLIDDSKPQNFFGFGGFNNNGNAMLNSSFDNSRFDNSNSSSDDGDNDQESSSNNDTSKEDNDESKEESEDDKQQPKIKLRKEEHVSRLFDFLNSNEINPLLASYFSRTVAELLQRKPDKMWPYIRDTQGANFLNNVIKHINTSAIWDLLMRLMTCKDASLKGEILNWLSTQGLVNALIDNLRPEQGDLRNQAASLALSDIVRLSRTSNEGSNNPLVVELEKLETVEKIIDIIVDSNQLALAEPDKIEECDCAILNATNVLLTFLEPNNTGNNNPLGTAMGLNPTDSIWSSAYHQDLLSKAQINAMNEHYKQTINMTLEALAPKMTYFCMILERDPVRHHPRAESNMGKDAEFKTLGATRLNICKLFTEILRHNNEEMNKIFVQHDVLKKLVDLFFEFCWNNFLHTLVSNCIQNIINPHLGKNSNDALETNSLPSISPSESTEHEKNEQDKDKNSGLSDHSNLKENNILIENLLVKCQLTQRIIAAFEYDQSRSTEGILDKLLIPYHSSNQKVKEKLAAKLAKNAQNSDSDNNPNKSDSNKNDDDGSISVHSAHDEIAENRRKKARKQRSKPPRLAYMGHLTKIANCIYEHTKGNEDVPSFLNEESYTQPVTFGMWTRPAMNFHSDGFGNSINKPAKKEKKIYHDVEEILTEKISKSAYENWDDFTKNSLNDQNQKNKRTIPVNEPKNFSNYLYSNNYDPESNRNEEEDNQDNDDENGYVSDEAKDLYKEYQETGLCQPPNFTDLMNDEYDSLKKAPGFKVSETDGSVTPTRGDDKLEDYHNVGKFELSLNDMTQAEKEEQEKLDRDREDFNALTRHRIPAVNEMYEDDEDLEQQELQTYAKDYSEIIAKDKNEWGEDDDDEDSDEEEDENNSRSPISGNSSEEDEAEHGNNSNENQPNNSDDNDDDFVIEFKDMSTPEKNLAATEAGNNSGQDWNLSPVNSPNDKKVEVEQKPKKEEVLKDPWADLTGSSIAQLNKLSVSSDGEEPAASEQKPVEVGFDAFGGQNPFETSENTATQEENSGTENAWADFSSFGQNSETAKTEDKKDVGGY